MKNPFVKEDNSVGLLTGLIIGAIATGGIVYLYFRKKKERAKAAAYLKEHAQDYLKEKARHHKRHKSDVHDLETIITH